MKRIAIIILTLIFLYSCKENKNKGADRYNSENETIKFDSTYYIQLQRAYIEKDTSDLKAFFQKWNDLSKDKINNSDQLTSTIENIFNEVYHPFELEKYGWISRPHYSKYKYAILPNEIRYEIVENFDSLNHWDEFSIYTMNMDTLSPFYPRPDIGDATLVYDIEPFKTSMQLFLNEDSYQKSFYLDSTNFILTPISNDWKEYQTSPEILGILINVQKDSALVDLRLISTGVRILLTRKDKKWKKEEVKELVSVR
jgi:hypothetical protein